MSDFIKLLEGLKEWIQLNALDETEALFGEDINTRVDEIIKSISEKSDV